MSGLTHSAHPLAGLGREIAAEAAGLWLWVTLRLQKGSCHRFQGNGCTLLIDSSGVRVTCRLLVAER